MEIVDVLCVFPGDCRPERIEPLGSAGGFSGASFWRIIAPVGVLCLRRWPSEHPSADGLRAIHQVLTHVFQRGLRVVPVPRLTQTGVGFVNYGGHLWELTPWMPGRADFRETPTLEKLRSAMRTLAQFHTAAQDFPVGGVCCDSSPGIRQRLEQMTVWTSGGADLLARAIEPGYWPELEAPAWEILRQFHAASCETRELLQAAARWRVPLQPCIRDVWHDHVLFSAAEVTGLIDFGSLQIDNVAADVARLLGSLAHDDTRQWHAGLDAYCQLRPLSADELRLVTAFDRSSVCMSGLNWLDWIYRQRRRFADRRAVRSRIDEILGRLAHGDEVRSGRRPESLLLN